MVPGRGDTLRDWDAAQWCWMAEEWDAFSGARQMGKPCLDRGCFVPREDKKQVEKSVSG
jgi:hypothetical protein